MREKNNLYCFYKNSFFSLGFVGVLCRKVTFSFESYFVAKRLFGLRVYFIEEREYFYHD